ncbi:MAG: 23S rRNA (uracil(1939)-C(5))-methyltransferase RlmD [Coriobacteriia bacterium]|nr:23S rRNA (uracil(1939)-C(5))-methyltransferase RlmD [Coriobacteriia bacterium]
MDRTRTTIESLAHGGDGVTRLSDGRTAFVAGSCPGDVVTLEITEDHGRWVRAQIAELLEPSTDRVTPPCPYAGRCGGCQWQHVAYPRQLAEKKRSLIDALTRIGHIPTPDVADTVASPTEYGYRNKIELAVAGSGNTLRVGFTRAGSSEVIPIDDCMLLARAKPRMPKALSGALRFLMTRGNTEIVRAALRVSSKGEVAVDVRTAPGPFPRSLAARVLSEATGARTVTRTMVRGTGDTRDIAGVEVLAGSGSWNERLDGDRYRISPTSFFQVNTGAAELLRKTALEALGADGTLRVADLYAGAGTFTLPIARMAGEAVAVEASKHALSDLRHNLDAASLDVDIVPGDAAYVLSEIGYVDAALIDPPRSGISEKAMRALIDAHVPRIVYVSCDPATLARDVARLTEAGYTPGRFVPVDLFPQTYHLETVAVLTTS